MEVFERDYSKYNIYIYKSYSLLWKWLLNAFSSKDIHFLDLFLDLETYPVDMNR